MKPAVAICAGMEMFSLCLDVQARTRIRTRSQRGWSRFRQDSPFRWLPMKRSFGARPRRSWENSAVAKEAKFGQQICLPLDAAKLLERQRTFAGRSKTWPSNPKLQSQLRPPFPLFQGRIMAVQENSPVRLLLHLRNQPLRLRPKSFLRVSDLGLIDLCPNPAMASQRLCWIMRRRSNVRCTSSFRTKAGATTWIV